MGGSKCKDDVDTFDYLMKTFVGLCKDLKIFVLRGVYNKPKILKYITKNYPNHFVISREISTLEHIPLKFSGLNLEHLAAYRYASHIEYLILKIKSLDFPGAEGWGDYKEILSFFPNLKGIKLDYFMALSSASP